MTSSYWESRPERLKLANIYHVLAEVIGWDEAVRVGMLVWDNMRPPSRRDSRAKGREGVVYIPKKWNAKNPPAAASLLGPETFRALISRFPGEILNFPPIEATSNARMNPVILEELAEGATQKFVACRFGIKVRTVGRIVAAAKA